MASATVDKLRKKSLEDLSQEATDLKIEIAKISRERYDSDGKEFAKISRQKKKLARILTVITEKANQELLKQMDKEIK